MIEAGNKIHVTTRRNFESDLRRHFAGEISAVSGTSVRVRGFLFVFDSSRNEFVRKPETRESIFDLAESGHFVTFLPADIKLDDLRYRYTADRGLEITDQGDFHLNVSEFGHNR